MKKIIFASLLLTAAYAFADTTTPTTTTTNAATTTTINCKDENSFPIVSKSDVQTLIQNKSTVVFDVNGKESFQKAHIPGAIDYVSNEKKFTTYLLK